MTLQSKEEIIIQLGKYGLIETTDKKIFNKFGYLGGIPPFDEKFSNKKRNEYILTFEIRPRGLEIKIDHLFTAYRTGFLHEQIEFFVIERQKQILEKKGKSVVGRALLGGILLGPVGAIVGGMTGIGNKEVNALQVDNILSIKINQPDALLTFSGDNKDYSTVENYLKKFFKEKYKKVEELDNFNSSKNQPTVFATSIADELIKLKSLVDNGVLTQDEFEIQKQKILNR